MSNYLSTILQIGVAQNKLDATEFPNGISYRSKPGYAICIDINMVAAATVLDYITVYNDGRVEDSLHDSFGMSGTTANYGWQKAQHDNEEFWCLDAVVHIEQIQQKEHYTAENYLIELAQYAKTLDIADNDGYEDAANMAVEHFCMMHNIDLADVADIRSDFDYYMNQE